MSPETLAALLDYDTCTLANGIESFNVRLRNVGFTDATIRNFTACPRPIAGYAVTARIRCSNPPTEGGGYVDRTDWWNHIVNLPAPRIAVIEDLDAKPGLGSFLGEIHAHILQALGCVAAVTNGSVRDLPAVAASGFHVFANHVSVSHAYAHVVDFGQPVKVAGLEICPGDVLHADMHGVLSVPLAIAGELPRAAQSLIDDEKALIALCESGEATIDKLRSAVRRIFH
jgi:regulator of RNase E activity RraA